MAANCRRYAIRAAAYHGADMGIFCLKKIPQIVQHLPIEATKCLCAVRNDGLRNGGMDKVGDGYGTRREEFHGLI